VLIISNDLQNEFADKVIVAPLTTDDLECIEPFEVLVEKTNENKLEQDSKILFDSLFSLNKKLRLQYCLGFINNKQKELVKKVLITIFELG
jgi:mRNA-degrading endonuclease toxin of MazEF toxin-antitoxin module